MPSHSVFCSHCGSAQTVNAAASPWFLRCAICRAATIGLGLEWKPCDAETALELPLPPVVSYQENVAVCDACDASLSLEMTIRSAAEACARCAGFELELAASTSIAPLLSKEELSFLTSPIH